MISSSSSPSRSRIRKSLEPSELQKESGDASLTKIHKSKLDGKRDSSLSNLCLPQTMSPSSSPIRSRPHSRRNSSGNAATYGKILGSPPSQVNLSRQLSRLRVNGGSPSKGFVLNSPTQESIQKRVSAPNSHYSSPSRRSSVAGGTSNGIKVIARFRPENDDEKRSTSQEEGSVEDFMINKTGVMEFQSESSAVYKYKEQVAFFTFDRIFPPESSQKDIFEYSVNETVQDVFQGYNGTILAYGQTGSGKTYTMMGNSIDDDEQKGLIPRIAKSIFDSIMLSSSDIEYTVGVSYMEIYMEKIRDLINTGTPSNMLQIHEDKENGVHVKNLQKVYVTSPAELYNIMKEGSSNRAVASTNMNQESSRSHAIFQIIVTQKITSTGMIKNSSLFLVDLAGSEKVAKTGASGQTLEEAKKINSSLSSLGNVINALTDGKSQHVPYRDSKLTRILQESLGGNSRTSLIVNCSPSPLNAEETLSTLRFGSRAKKIKNKAHINTELSPKELKKNLSRALDENNRKNDLIQELVKELSAWRGNEQPQKSLWIDISSYATDNGTLAEDPLYELPSSFNNLSDKIVLNETEALENVSLNQKIQQLQLIINDLEGSYHKKLEDKTAEIVLLKSQLEAEKRSKAVWMSEIEQLKTKLHKKVLTRTEKQKILGLERALESLARKLDDMAMQNHILKKDISTTRTIAETRVERIKTLESVVKSQQNAVQKESQQFAKKLDTLTVRIQNVKKLQEVPNRSIITSPMSDSNFNYSSLMSPTTPLFESTFDRSREFGDSSVLLENSLESQVNTSSEKLAPSVQLPEIQGSKRGLNFRIVKPLRGGNGAAGTSDEFNSISNS